MKLTFILEKKGCGPRMGMGRSGGVGPTKTSVATKPSVRYSDYVIGGSARYVSDSWGECLVLPAFAGAPGERGLGVGMAARWIRSPHRLAQGIPDGAGAVCWVCGSRCAFPAGAER